MSMLDFDALRTIHSEIMELREKLYQLEETHEQMIFDATAIWLGQGMFTNLPSKDWAENERQQAELIIRLIDDNRNAVDIAAVLCTSVDYAQTLIDRQKWLQKAKELDRVLEYDHTLSYHAKNEVRAYWRENAIFNIAQAQSVSDLKYMTLRNIGKVAAKKLRTVLDQADNS